MADDEATEVEEGPLQDVDSKETKRGHDVETLKLLHSDAHRSLDEGVKAFSDLSSKAIRLAQVNGLIITIIITVASQLQVSQYVNAATALGVVLILLSTLLSVWAYSTHNIHVGIGPGVIDRTLEKKPNQAEYLNWILSGVYEESMTNAKRKVNRKGVKVKWAIRLFLGGLLALLTGILLFPYL